MNTKTSRTKFKTPHEKTKTSATTKKPAIKQVASPEVKPRIGKLGDLLGYSVVSVIRAMGKAGWDYDTARAVLDKAGVAAAKHTLKLGLKRGRDGQKRIAPLTAKQLDSLRFTSKTKKSQ